MKKTGHMRERSQLSLCSLNASKCVFLWGHISSFQSSCVFSVSNRTDPIIPGWTTINLSLIQVQSMLPKIYGYLPSILLPTKNVSSLMAHMPLRTSCHLSIHPTAVSKSPLAGTWLSAENNVFMKIASQAIFPKQSRAGIIKWIQKTQRSILTCAQGSITGQQFPHGHPTTELAGDDERVCY